jgi:GTPase Era involved in 16S rRNA processing
VGTAARLELEKIFGLRFYLETHVKVKPPTAATDCSARRDRPPPAAGRAPRA